MDTRLLRLTPLVIVLVLSGGCSRQPVDTPTTVRVEGLENSLQHQGLMKLQPFSIDLGTEKILCVPEGSSRNKQFSVRYKFYKLVENTLVEVKIDQRSSA